MSLEVIFFNGIGFVGLGLFLWAYAMINLGLWHEKQLRFHVPNLLGAICVMISLMHDWNLPVFILEICWGSVALYGMWQCRKYRSE